MNTFPIRVWLSLLLMCGLIGGDVAKVTDYTYAAVADDRPNFPLTRPSLDASGVVRLKTSAMVGAGGVRPSKCVPDVGARAGVRADFKTCKTRYDALSPAEVAQWTTWAGEDDMDVFQFFMRTCQVYERRSMGWPPAAMDAWKGWVCEVACHNYGVWPLIYFGLQTWPESVSGVATCNVAVKRATDDAEADSDVVVKVTGWYDDGGGDQWYEWSQNLGAGAGDWQNVQHVTADHSWHAYYPRIIVYILHDRGSVFVDEMYVSVGGVIETLNPHFNLGYGDQWGGYAVTSRIPDGFDRYYAASNGAFKLLYLEDVP